MSFFITKKAGRKNEYKNDCLQITESPADARAKKKINQIQAYSPKAGKMITKYIVIESRELEDGRTKNETLLETYSMVDIAKLLALLYRGDDA